MQRLLYLFFVSIYPFIARILALWNDKARLWSQGRNNWQQNLVKNIPANTGKRYWMHCASLGEFEQGRPLLEAIREQDADCFILLSFFSPSGYEVRKDYQGANMVVYLPMDGPGNAKRFLDLVKPDLALFVKYEFWYYYLRALHQRKVPTVLVSGAFRKDQPFFNKWYGGFFRSMLSCFSLITVQDSQSQDLLKQLGINAVLTGDTRYDRVIMISENLKPLPLIEAFKGDKKLIIAGSSWPDDETRLKQCLPLFPEDWKLVLAPHEIDKTHLETIYKLFGTDCIPYSRFRPGMEARVLIIDNIGLLSSLYRYGELAWIGGGFNSDGIHNILEPAVFGLHVFFGSNYQKFTEAVEMVRDGFATPLKPDAVKDCLPVISAKMKNLESLYQEQRLIKAWVRGHAGATYKILKLLADAE